MRPRLGYGILACVACASLGGSLASAAQAATFHAESSPTYLLGSQSTENVFTFDGRSIECADTTLTGELTGTEADRLEGVHPEYSDCTAVGLEATVTTTGCDYTLYEPTGSEPYAGTMGILCKGGHKMEFVFGLGVCTVTVGTQGLLGTVTYTDKKSGVLVTFDVSGITGQVSGSEEVCGTGGSQEGTYTGSVLVKGYSDPAHAIRHGFWVG